MAIPKFDEIMAPILKLCLDGETHRMRDLVSVIGEQMGLTKEEMEQTIPSGSGMFNNRAWWARSFLVKAELLEAPRRGYIKITDLGKKIISENNEVTVALLKTLPNFEKNWGDYEDKQGIKSSSNITDSSKTPEEIFEESYRQIREALIEEVTASLKNITYTFFERVVVDVLIAMGYGGGRKEAGQAIGKSGDGGIDGVINEDKLGLDVIYVQAKHWQGNVGGPDINSFVGSLEAKKANKGVFFTTSSYTRQAHDIVAQVSKKIVLIDGYKLAELMIDHNIGVTSSRILETKKIDSDYFNEE